MPSALLKPRYKNVIRFLGDAVVPPDILRRRRWTQQMMQRLGTPVLIKHKFNVEDVEKGIAQPSTNFDTIFDQSTHDDPFSYGVGYVSVQTAPEEWIKPGNEREGPELVLGEGEPEFEPAPLYRGFGPGYLTYVIMPDVPQDIFKLTDEGALIKTQQARCYFPWTPLVGDNDLLIVCEIDGAERIINTFERYILKQVQPTTMRGTDRQGRREFAGELTASGNRHVVSQYCELALVPPTEPIYKVETDR